MLLLSTSSLAGYGLHKIFEIGKKSGYDGIDLVQDDGLFDTWNKEYLKHLSESFSLPVYSITAPSNGLSEERVDTIIEIAEYISAKVVVFTPPHINDKNTKWFKSHLAKILKNTEIKIAVQNVPPKFMFFIIPEYKNSTLDEIKKVTGFTSLDIAGIDAGSGMDIIKAERILGTTIEHIALSDKNGDTDGLLPGNLKGGVSYLPIESFLMKLKSEEYSGSIALKVNPKELTAGNDDIVIQKLQGIKQYYKKHFIDFK